NSRMEANNVKLAFTRNLSTYCDSTGEVCCTTVVFAGIAVAAISVPFPAVIDPEPGTYKQNQRDDHRDDEQDPCQRRSIPHVLIGKCIAIDVDVIEIGRAAGVALTAPQNIRDVEITKQPDYCQNQVVENHR